MMLTRGIQRLAGRLENCAVRPAPPVAGRAAPTNGTIFPTHGKVPGPLPPHPIARYDAHPVPREPRM